MHHLLAAHLPKLLLQQALSYASLPANGIAGFDQFGHQLRQVSVLQGGHAQPTRVQSLLQRTVGVEVGRPAGAAAHPAGMVQDAASHDCGAVQPLEASQVAPFWPFPHRQTPSTRVRGGVHCV